MLLGEIFYFNGLGFSVIASTVIAIVNNGKRAYLTLSLKYKRERLQIFV